MKKISDSDREKMKRLFEARRRKRVPDERVEKAKKAFKAKPYDLGVGK